MAVKRCEADVSCVRALWKCGWLEVLPLLTFPAKGASRPTVAVSRSSSSQVRPSESTMTRVIPRILRHIKSAQTVMPPLDPSAADSHTAAEVHQYPKPLLRLQLPDLGHAGSRAFLSSVHAEDALRRAVETVLSILYPGHRHVDQVQAASPFPRPTPWPGTRSVTLVIDPYGDGVAYTTGKHLDGDHKEIHLMASYVSGQSAERVTAEIHGVLVHEMVHCWQWAAQGTANGGLIEGIADWVRLKANLGPPHWRRRNGDDVSWDSGYETTAYFLDWLDSERCGPGTVVRLNDALRDCKDFQADDFFQRVVGEKVSRLWKEYREIPT